MAEEKWEKEIKPINYKFGTSGNTLDEQPQALQVSSNNRRATSKLLTFALLLAVPAVMTGCNSNSDCNPEYENCSTSGGGYHGGGYYGSGGSSKSSSIDDSVSSKSSGTYKGFGSSGISSSGG